MVEIIDHEESLSNVMPYMWVSKPTVNGMIRAIGRGFQDLENTSHQILNSNLYNASGVELNNIGLIVNLSRDGRLDEEYRSALLATAASWGASGTTRDIKRVAKLTTKADICQVFSHYPLCTYVFVNSPVSQVEAISIQDAHMATVRTRVIWSVSPYYVRTIAEPLNYELYAECGEPEFECGSEFAESGGGGSLSDSTVYLGSVGFTSLAEGATSYNVVDDRGVLCACASEASASVETGYIIDDQGNYIVFNDGSKMRYIG